MAAVALIKRNLRPTRCSVAIEPHKVARNSLRVAVRWDGFLNLSAAAHRKWHSLTRMQLKVLGNFYRPFRGGGTGGFACPV